MSKKKSPTKKKDVPIIGSKKKTESPPLENPAELKSKQARLPQMDDPIIEDLEDAAIAYASVRDERMALTAKEVDRKDLLLQLMKRHDRTKYVRDGITIERTVEKEKVRVRIKREED